MTKARRATPTVTFVDEYAQRYQDLFADVRSFEAFKQLLIGMLFELKRKTLPAVAKAVGADAQALHHVVAYAPWSVDELRKRRLSLVHQALDSRPFVLCIDETGDRKKGKTTDYVAHQYIGNLGKLANGIVSVNAYGILDHITFPLLFKIYKPKTRLQPGDTYKTKPQLAVELIQELQQWGFRFEVVLADRFAEHRWWDSGQGWKNILNNLRLVLQPYVYYCLLLPWLLLFDIPGFRAGFSHLITIMNSLHAALPF